MRAYTRAMPRECYCAVLRAAARKMTAIYDAALAPVGIGVAQYSLLRTIERRGPLSLTELGRITEHDRSTIGRNVRLLQRMGLVGPADTADRRESRIALTGAGQETLARAEAPWAEAQRSIEARLGGDAAARLRDQLEAF